MGPPFKAWFENLRATYIGNAQAVRDYRSQLRGTRPLLFWGAYLATLILTATISYGTLVHDGQDYSSSQAALHSVYMILMGLLGVVVTIAAPALTATAITQERQRRSIELVACAPITTRYYLVGKMLSSFRYIWMLLILSLPVTSMCVVLGGASWNEVLAGYVLLSASGLVMTAISLLISAISRSGIAALNTAYLLIAGIYLPATAAISGLGIFSHDTFDAPWYGGLFPLAAPLAAPTYSSIFGFAVPNYLFVCLFSLLAVRFILLGAASAMGHYASSDIAKFRKTSLVALGLVSLWTAALTKAAVLASQPGEDEILKTWRMAVSLSIGPIGFVIMFLAAHLCVSSRYAEERYRNDGAFNLRKIWLGTPSSGLPFALALGLVGLIPSFVYNLTGPQRIAATDQAMLIAWTFAGIITAWLMARAASLKNVALPQARASTMAGLAAIFAVPAMVVAILSGFVHTADNGEGLLRLTFISLFIGQGNVGTLLIQLLTMAAVSIYSLKKIHAEESNQETASTGIALPEADALSLLGTVPDLHSEGEDHPIQIRY